VVPKCPRHSALGSKCLRSEVSVHRKDSSVLDYEVGGTMIQVLCSTFAVALPAYCQHPLVGTMIGQHAPADRGTCLRLLHDIVAIELVSSG